MSFYFIYQLQWYTLSIVNQKNNVRQQISQIDPSGMLPCTACIGQQFLWATMNWMIIALIRHHLTLCIIHMNHTFPFCGFCHGIQNCLHWKPTRTRKTEKCAINFLTSIRGIKTILSSLLWKLSFFIPFHAVFPAAQTLSNAERSISNIYQENFIRSAFTILVARTMYSFSTPQAGQSEILGSGLPSRTELLIYHSTTKESFLTFRNVLSVPFHADLSLKVERLAYHPFSFGLSAFLGQYFEPLPQKLFNCWK